MKDDSALIEQRLQNLKNFYLKLGTFIDSLPPFIPGKAKNIIKTTIFNDKDLKNLIDGIDSHRPPRVFLIGRTGVGKSSLINALFGNYVAEVSDVRSCTPEAIRYECKDKDRVLMEILDTRGINESERVIDSVSAEEQLVRQISEFSPDVAILMLSCTHRDDVDDDIDFLIKIAEEYSRINKVRLPLVVVINKCDEMAPARFKKAEEYPENKIRKINEVVLYYKSIILNKGLKIDNIIPVSSLIDWKTADGLDVDVDQIKNLPPKDIDNIEIGFDGRYNIQQLFDVLENSITDVDAQMGLRMAFRLEEIVKRMANQLTKIFAGLSATVALTPIPVADIYVLIILQAALVSLIASLSGREVSLDSAKEFIFSMGGVIGAGFIFRLTAQQLSKLINVIFPAAGSAVSAGVASAGTMSVGRAATSYYIEGNDIKEVRKKFKELQQSQKNKKK